MYSNLNHFFPAQKKSRSQKTLQWQKDCINGAENAAIWRDEGVRQSYKNKRINFNLYSDILDQSDIEKVCNPTGIMGYASPAKMQNYPILNPKIDLLVGEEINRGFDFKVRVMNDDAISSKETELKHMMLQMITGHIQNKDISEDLMKETLSNHQNYVDFEYQDSKERLATQILRYLYSHQRMGLMFSKGFKDALIGSEEIYQCDIIAGEPVAKKLNSLNVHTVRSGESPYIEDSDIIVITGYMSPGQIVDEYHDKLKPAQISFIETGMVGNVNSQSGIDIGYKPDLPIKLTEGIELSILESDLSFGSPFDNNGNIKVTKVYWKSMKKVKRVKYYDSQGDVQFDLFDETYKINKEAGETEEILWISEWWEGHKIGGANAGGDDKAIYCKIQPRPVQFRSMENPSKCHPGIVGTVYNTNDNTGMSMLDRGKPYQYLYNVLAYNAELAIAKNWGKIARIDLASVPEGWNIDQWLSFAQGMGVAFYDSFKEGNKGAAMGKIAGGMHPQAPVIDTEMGNTIQLYLSMMQYIKQEMGEITGVSQARQGQIHQRQAVGNTQMEVNQSSHVTEYWFNEHEHTKLRVLECLLETAKYAWKDVKNKKIQYILDDGSTTILTIDGEQFNEAEYGVLLTNGKDAYELKQNLKQLAHAGIQNQMITFSQLMDIWNTESIASVRRKIERSERAMQERQEQAEKRKEKLERDRLAAAAEEQDKARDFTREEWDREDARKEMEGEVKLAIERMRQDNETSRHYDPADTGEDRVTIENLMVQKDKIQKDYELKKRAQKETERHNKKTESQKDAEIKVKKTTAKKKPN